MSLDRDAIEWVLLQNLSEPSEHLPVFVRFLGLELRAEGREIDAGYLNAKPIPVSNNVHINGYVTGGFPSIPETILCRKLRVVVRSRLNELSSRSPAIPDDRIPRRRAKPVELDENHPCRVEHAQLPRFDTAGIRRLHRDAYGVINSVAVR